MVITDDGLMFLFFGTTLEVKLWLCVEYEPETPALEGRWSNDLFSRVPHETIRIEKEARAKSSGGDSQVGLAF